MNMEVYFNGNKKVNAKWNGHDIQTDQPEKGGGEGSAPSPFDLFLASIGTCTGIYVKNFCDQRNIPSDNIKVIQKLNFNQSTRLIDKIDVEIQLPEDFPDKYRDAVVKAAEKCTVKRHLQDPPEIAVETTNHERTKER